MWTDYLAPASLDEALEALAARAPNARLIAGGTDLLIELDLGVRAPCALIDISRLPGLDGISIDAGIVHLGPLVTHAQVVADPRLRTAAAPLALACREIGAPQIRNRGTVAGNLITASPANDSITALMALDAEVTLRSVQGQRVVALRDFYTGVRKTVMRPDEMLTDIAFAALAEDERGAWIKLGLRRAQAISLVNTAVTIARDSAGRITRARIALGAVTPTIVRVPEAEAALVGGRLGDAAIAAAAKLARAAAHPISDVRASAEYRLDMVGVLVARALRAILADAPEPAETPALLWMGETPGQLAGDFAVVNGVAVDWSTVHEKSLLRALREDAGLTGTKEGCAEGECGSCTVLLDGKAVMSCLVPAERALGADVVTIEGVAALGPDDGDGLHPLQKAFIAAGAVQCGYCTPGLILSGATLLAEHAAPTREQVKEAISGNLCRCTGYYKILEAFDLAAGAGQPA
ncbi:MAG: FAD binding domain-containing protein [Anaerolineae bacterium]|nr:FAD binding domain-containing protein [Anaerolineae bacterium]